MLLGTLSMALNPSSPANQGMFTVNRQTNDELDVTARMADGDSGPYVLVFPMRDFKQAPTIEIEPLDTSYAAESWYMSSLSPTAMGVAKTPGAGSGTDNVRLLIRRPR